MDRRELLRILGSTAAFAGWSPTRLEGLLVPGGTARSQVSFFDATERGALTAFADAVIPATDTPGAVETGSVEFVELVVSRVFDVGEQGRFRAGLAELDSRARAGGAPSFEGSGPEVRTRILETMQEQGSKVAEAAQEPSGSFFHTARNLIMEGHYTSEVGMKAEQGFVPIPGRYDGSVPVEEVTRGGVDG